MNKKILYEVFGITDPDNTGRRPGGLEFERDRTVISDIPVSPFTPKPRRHSYTQQCVFLTTSMKCGIGCDYIRIKKDNNCPYVSLSLLDPDSDAFTKCPCYSNNVRSVFQDIKYPHDFTLQNPLASKLLTGWQRDIYNSLNKNLTNLIISVPPGGGKTRPVKIYFYERIVNFLSDPTKYDLPKLIYVVPTKQLALQIKNNDFLKDPDYGLYSILTNVHDQHTPTSSAGTKQDKINDLIQNAVYGGSFPNDNEIITFIRFLAESFIQIVSEDFPNPSFIFDSKITNKFPILKNKIKPVIIIVKSNNMATNVNKHLRNANHVFVDEVQELLPKPGEYKISKDASMLFLQLCKIIKSVRNNTKIHLMTGSVNDETLVKLRDNFFKYLKIKFEFIPDITERVKMDNKEERKLDSSSSPNRRSGIIELPGTKNRSRLNIVPLQKLSTPSPIKNVKEQSNLIQQIIRSDQNNSIMIIFSTRNFAKTSIINVVSNAISQLRPRDIRFFYDSDIDSTPIPLSINKKTNEFIVNYNGINRPDLIKLVGTQEIKNMILQDKTQHGYEKIEVDQIEFLQFFDKYELDSNNPNINNMVRKRIPDNVLYQGVLRGIGIMIGKMHPLHKATIQNLFIKKKLQILVATDALGIGANVDCQHLYIPTIIKPGEFGFKPNDWSSLTQLINRAGRGRFPSAYIYCRDDDVDVISRLANPEFVENEDNRQRSVSEIIPELDVDSLVEIMKKA